ncbi:unnamed protein product [Symbiodinium microadriaticum]|nr:unnamed protein product [Symbiodinium microadriaticum]
MALREEITKKKDLEERRQISERRAQLELASSPLAALRAHTLDPRNRFHKVERKNDPISFMLTRALDAIEKLHTDAQLRAQRINEQRRLPSEQKLQQELKELRAMSVHRQSKDGDAAGFGDRLFEESKQRQERKQTRALQAHNEAKAAAQPGVGAPGAPTSPRGVLHLYEASKLRNFLPFPQPPGLFCVKDAARREESLVERRLFVSADPGMFCFGSMTITVSVTMGEATKALGG